MTPAQQHTVQDLKRRFIVNGFHRQLAEQSAGHSSPIDGTNTICMEIQNKKLGNLVNKADKMNSFPVLLQP